MMSARHVIVSKAPKSDFSRYFVALLPCICHSTRRPSPSPRVLTMGAIVRILIVFTCVGFAVLFSRLAKGATGGSNISSLLPAAPGESLPESADDSTAARALAGPINLCFANAASAGQHVYIAASNPSGPSEQNPWIATMSALLSSRDIPVVVGFDGDVFRRVTPPTDQSFATVYESLYAATIVSSPSNPTSPRVLFGVDTHKDIRNELQAAASGGDSTPAARLSRQLLENAGIMSGSDSDSFLTSKMLAELDIKASISPLVACFDMDTRSTLRRFKDRRVGAWVIVSETRDMENFDLFSLLSSLDVPMVNAVTFESYAQESNRGIVEDIMRSVAMLITVNLPVFADEIRLRAALHAIPHIAVECSYGEGDSGHPGVSTTYSDAGARVIASCAGPFGVSEVRSSLSNAVTSTMQHAAKMTAGNKELLSFAMCAMHLESAICAL
jgi:hypothetical protein